MWPVIGRHFPRGGAIFIDDGAPVHRAKIVNSWTEHHIISSLPWSPYSPDLNPIENCWAVIKQRLQSNPLSIESVVDLLKTHNPYYLAVLVSIIHAAARTPITNGRTNEKCDEK